MDDVRTLAAVERRRKMAWTITSLIHSKLRFEKVIRAARAMTEEVHQTTSRLEDFHLTLEVKRMWDEARPAALVAPSAAGEAVGAAPGGDHA